MLGQLIENEAVRLRGAGRDIELAVAAHPIAVGAAEVVMAGQHDRRRGIDLPLLGEVRGYGGHHRAGLDQLGQQGRVPSRGGENVVLPLG
jgi:hypothetical protein